MPAAARWRAVWGAIFPQWTRRLDLVEPLSATNGGNAPAGHEAAERTVRWCAEQVRSIRADAGQVAPIIGETDFEPVGDDIDVWDAWPVQDMRGNPAVLDGQVTLWMALCAPRRADPDERHGLARIHLFERRSGKWGHLGPVFPDDFTPGSREWSGSAVLAGDGTELTAYFTAAGESGEAVPSFKQRLFSARATLTRRGKAFGLEDWRDLTEIVERDQAWYMASDAGSGSVGTIKAFRDPAYFFDATSGRHWIFFAGSLAGSRSSFNGVVGAAVSRTAQPADWTLTPPVISADGLNNELERPHVIAHGGRYYLFWSTQAHVFDPAGPAGPTGLYGMVSERIDGGWRPLNGTALVFANPPEAPAQAYSWLVLPDLSVISFVDDWGHVPGEGPRRFGASFAPKLHLRLDGDTAVLAG